MPAVEITHPDSSTETIPETDGYQHQREVGAMDKLTIDVFRSDATAVTLNEKQDEIELVGVADGYRLTSVDTTGVTWTLICYSKEIDGNREPPTQGGDKRSGTDKDLLTTIINDVSDWSIGSLAELTGNMSFIFNHAKPQEAARRIEKNVPGELRFNADGSVDYVDALGTDKTGSITLAPGQANLDGEITVESKGRELDGTHIRVIGAHEGEAQIFANLVPQGDPSTYDNEVRYSTPRWSDASDTDWDRWENKDVADQDTIEEEAAALAEEMKDPLVEVSATVVGEDLAVGDFVHVEKPDANINRDMRVHRITTKLVPDDGTKVVDECLLSTRTTVRAGEVSKQRDIQRFNTAFQGSAVWGTPSGGYQAVTGSDNYRLTFFYPDVEYEHTAELYIESQEYRTFHSGAASGGGSTETSAGGGSFTTTETSTASSMYDDPLGGATGATALGDTNGTWDVIDSISSSGFVQLEDVQWTYISAIDSSNVPDVRVRTVDPQGDTDYWPEQAGTTMSFGATGDEQTGQSILAPITADEYYLEYNWDADVGDNLSVAYHWIAKSDHTHEVTVSVGDHTHDVTIPNHTHPVEPGVSLFPGTTVSNVDLLVNGVTEATNIGSGTFTQTVDITGLLNKGQFNTIELTSDSTGWLYATAGLESYRQIGTR